MIIGQINIEKPLLLAPMEGVTDLPFRLICKSLGADIVYTEFVNSEGLVRNSDKTHKKMEFLEEERPVGIQIYGGYPNSMQRAAQMAEELHPDIIDINCGCWVKNVTNNGAGSDLLRDLPRMEKIIRNVVQATRLPVTVKTRLGWDSENIRIVEVARLAEQSGAAGLTIHCRTRAQAHKGDPDYSWIAKVKEAVKIPIIVNGSIGTPEQIVRLFDITGCDAVMIGRAAIDNPWLFKQARNFLVTGTFDAQPSIHERFDILLKHLNLSLQFKGNTRGIFEFRKHYAGYLKGYPHAAKIRMELMNYKEYPPIADLLLEYKEKLIKNLESAEIITQQAAAT
jgi:tRNA-dihydrouridine synthase B